MNRGYQIFPRGKKYLDNFDNIFESEQESQEEQDQQGENEDANL